MYAACTSIHYPKSANPAVRDLVLVIHISLDGFVADLKGKLDGFPMGEENLAFVCHLARKADSALLGRISFELLDSYWPTAHERPHASPATIAFSTWYNRAQKVIVSRTPQNVKAPTVCLIGDDFLTGVQQIKQEPGKQIVVFGVLLPNVRIYTLPN